MKLKKYTMKKFYLFLLTASCMLFNTHSFADITLTTSPVPVANIDQGSADNIVYIVKMDVTASAVSVNNIQFTLTGTHDNNDLTNVKVYYNPATPSLSGATIMINTSGSFAAPNTYNLNFANVNIPAGELRYFIITFNADATATGGHTIKLDGAANPVSFGYTTPPLLPIAKPMLQVSKPYRRQVLHLALLLYLLLTLPRAPATISFIL
jgi:hypothetical protein